MRVLPALWASFLVALTTAGGPSLHEEEEVTINLQIPRRIVLWNGAGTATVPNSCSDVREVQRAYSEANAGFDVDVRWGYDEGEDGNAEFATTLGRNALVCSGLGMLRRLRASGGVYVSDASWPGKPFAAVLTEDDAFVMGVAVDGETGERRLLFLAAAEQSSVTAALVSAAETALHAPDETYRRIWADPFADSMPADLLEQRHFTGVAMMGAAIQPFVSAGAARVAEYDLRLAMLLAGGGDAACSEEGRIALMATVVGDGMTTPVFLDPSTGEDGPNSIAGALESASTTAVGIRQVLAPGQYLAPARSGKAVAAAALKPIWVGGEAAPACAAAAHGCFLWLSRDGQLALYIGMGLLDPAAHLVKILSAAPPAAAAGAGAGTSGGSTRWLALEDSGEAVLYSAKATGTGESSTYGAAVMVWQSGSALPASCLESEACHSRAFLAVGDDGRLELRRHLSAAMMAYVTVGAAANKRVSTCLWHNGFAAEAVAAGSATVPPRAQPSSAVFTAECQVPPVLVLATFPNSGTSFTLRATQDATEHSVFTRYETEVLATHEDTAGLQDLCGVDSCHALGMCQISEESRVEIAEETRAANGGPPPASDSPPLQIGDVPPVPPPGKGALIKSHVCCSGTGKFYGFDGVDQYRAALALGANDIPLERYGVLRLFRNPFDNMVARFHLLVDTGQIRLSRDKAGFLVSDGHIPKRDIYTYLYWHLNANIVFRELGLPVALLHYQDIYDDTVGYLRAVVSMLGWSPEEVPDSQLQRVADLVMAREFWYLRSGEPIPVYIDEYYEAEMIEYIADAINAIVDRTDCLQVPNYLDPPIESIKYNSP